MRINRRGMAWPLLSGSLAFFGLAPSGVDASESELAKEGRRTAEPATSFGLADLQAREAIKELGARYCWHVARAEAQAISELYAPDGMFETPVGDERRRFVGRAAIRVMLETGVAPGQAHPLVGNHILRIDGSRAAGTCDMHRLIQSPKGFIHTAGYYDDSYVRDGDAWFFATRRWFPLASAGQ